MVWTSGRDSLLLSRQIICERLTSKIGRRNGSDTCLIRVLKLHRSQNSYDTPFQQFLGRQVLVLLDQPCELFIQLPMRLKRHLGLPLQINSELLLDIRLRLNRQLVRLFGSLFNRFKQLDDLVVVLPQQIAELLRT